MQSSFDRRGPRLDTSLPSIRHVQGLIRSRSEVVVTMSNGQELRGKILWQDLEYMAVLQEEGRPPALLNRHGVMMLRALA
jgi:host factor-I protein